MSTTRTTRAVSGRVTAVVLLAVVAAVVLGSAAPRAAADSPETAVIDWNAHAMTALVAAPTATPPGAGLTPPVTAVHLPIVQAAVFDAVNSIDGGYEPYLDGLPAAPVSASKAGAVARAAHDTLVAVLNQLPLTATFTSTIRAQIISRLDAELSESLAEALADEVSKDPNGAAARVAAGVAAGDAAADAMIEERSSGGVPDDGRFPANPFMFEVGTEAGEWRPTATPPVNDPFAWVKNVRPYAVVNGTQFLSNGPAALKSGLYAKEYNEVKELGDADRVRSQDEEDLVFFFQPHAVEMFVRSLRTYASGQGLSLPEQARFFGLLSMAVADAAITCWEDKAHWSFWRPQTAIRLGDDDGNPKTDGDEDWNSEIGAPPYPDHSSGFNCVAGSTTEVAEQFFGQGRTTFVLERTAGGLTRQYDHFRNVVDDVIDVRVLQGIHFRSADEQGAKIGRDVASWVEKHELRPAH